MANIVYKDKLLNKENKYSKSILEKAYSRFQKLRQNSDYRFDYAIYKAILNAYIKNKDKDISRKLALEVYYWHDCISDRWKIFYPIDPDLALSRPNIYKKYISPYSALSTFVASFLDKENSQIWKGIKVPYFGRKSYKRNRDVRIRKFIAYSIKKTNPRTSLRSLARRFNTDHHTIKRWLNDVEKWTTIEKEAVLAEIHNYNLPEPE